jgi:hypothetical protein
MKCGYARVVTIDSRECSTAAEKASGVIRITDNLENLLLAIRDEEKYITLWIDSICINQDDVAEKTAQVKMIS